MNEITKLDKMPPNIIRIAKTHQMFNDWRTSVTNGSPHPVLREDEYIRINIGKLRMESSSMQPSSYNSSPIQELEKYEHYGLKTFLERIEVAWAVDNSFDGVYVVKEMDYNNFNTNFIFSVYLKQEQATFWTLKYG